MLPPYLKIKIFSWGQGDSTSASHVQDPEFDPCPLAPQDCRGWLPKNKPSMLGPLRAALYYEVGRQLKEIGTAHGPPDSKRGFRIARPNLVFNRCEHTSLPLLWLSSKATGATSPLGDPYLPGSPTPAPAPRSGVRRMGWGRSYSPGPRREGEAQLGGGERAALDNLWHRRRQASGKQGQCATPSPAALGWDSQSSLPHRLGGPGFGSLPSSWLSWKRCHRGGGSELMGRAL